MDPTRCCSSRAARGQVVSTRPAASAPPAADHGVTCTQRLSIGSHLFLSRDDKGAHPVLCVPNSVRVAMMPVRKQKHV